MPTQIELRSQPGTGATALELVESRRGGGNTKESAAWEERVWIMQFTDTTWNTFNIYYATGVPAFGLNITGTNLYLIDKQIEPDPNDQTIVRVRCRFETPKFDQRQPRLNATQSKWSIVKSITYIPNEQRIEYDVNGKACINVIGEVFNPPITEIEQDAQVNISFLTNNSQAQYDMTQTLDGVNSTSFNITIGALSYFIDNGEMYFEKANVADSWDENGSRCGSCQLQMLYRSNSSPGAGDAWHELRPNQSLHFANNTSSPMSDIRPIMNSTVNNDYATDPHYLDENGSVIPPGGTIFLNHFVVKETANFSDLLSGLLT